MILQIIRCLCFFTLTDFCRFKFEFLNARAHCAVENQNAFCKCLSDSIFRRVTHSVFNNSIFTHSIIVTVYFASNFSPAGSLIIASL